MPPKARTQSKTDPVDAVIARTIRNHAEAARTRKEREEYTRLRPRRSIAKATFKALKKELQAMHLNGVGRSDERLAQLCEELAKTLAKAVGLESGGKHD